MARQDLVVWAGPVFKLQVPEATVPGAKELWIGCRGDKGPHPYCPSIGTALSSSPEKLLVKAKMPMDELGELFMGAFSAGGSLLKRLLANEEYRRITTAVMLSDATYTAVWTDQKNRIPPPIEGFVRWGVDVATGDGSKMFVATASPNPNYRWATGIENLKSIAKEIEKRTGLGFKKRDDFFGVEPGPVEVWQLKNIIFAYYPSKPLGHNHPKIASQVWQNILLPWLDTGKGHMDGEPPVPGLPAVPTSKDNDELGNLLLFAATLATGFYLTKRIMEK